MVLLAGPRQAGRTTLACQISGDGNPYLNLDNDLTLMSAREDPAGLIRSLDRAVIDEIQRAPGLLVGQIVPSLLAKSSFGERADH